MNQVWLFYKIIEVIMGMFCIYHHIKGSTYKLEPFPHNLAFCGSFIGFTILSCVGIWRILRKMRTLLYRELICCLAASILHVGCAFLAMYYAEDDFHLMYMGDKQELDHNFFAASKKQSIAAMVTGLMYCLHAMIILDVIMKTPRTGAIVDDETINKVIAIKRNGGYEYRDYMAKTSADIFFLCEPVDRYLRKRFKWFRTLAGEVDPERDRQFQRSYSSRRHTTTSKRSHNDGDASSKNYSIEMDDWMDGEEEDFIDESMGDSESVHLNFADRSPSVSGHSNNSIHLSSDSSRS